MARRTAKNDESPPVRHRIPNRTREEAAPDILDLSVTFNGAANGIALRGGE